MKFSFAIILLVLFAIRSDGQFTYIDIYNPKIDECELAVVQDFFRAFDLNEMGILRKLVSKKFPLDTNEVAMFRAKFTQRGGHLSFYQSDNPNRFQRIYSEVNNGKRENLFIVTIDFKENNKFIIDHVEFNERIKLPHKLRKALIKIDKKGLSPKEKGTILRNEFGPPYPPSKCSDFYDIDWDKNNITITGGDYEVMELLEQYFKNYTVINELGFPVRLVYYFYDSTGVPIWLQHLENLVELKIIAYEVKSVHETIGNLKNVKTLRLFLIKVKLAAIPASIGNLEQLEELTISCNDCTELPTTLRKLKNLKKFEFSGNKLNHESKLIVFELGGTIKHME